MSTTGRRCAAARAHSVPVNAAATGRRRRQKRIGMSFRNAQSLRSLKNLFSQVPFTGPSRRVRSAWVRLVVMAALFLVVIALAAGIRAMAGGSAVLAVPAGAVVVLGALVLYTKSVRLLEQRPVSELDPSVAGATLRDGTLVGVVLFAFTLVVIALFGSYGTEGGVSVSGALAVFATMAGVALTEELLFRGVVFRLLEELTGTWGALITSGLLFGAIHLVNAHTTVWGALAIAIEAGLMLGAAYVATRTLWLPIGLHLGWNFAEGGIFGVGVSGNANGQTGLLHGVLSGSDALTGGSVGPEASVVAIFVCSIPTIVFLRLAKRRGHFHTRRRIRSAATSGTAA
ncbi:CPBP family intramembrane glutamic endopeptidase [Streptomyces diacarni]|nr:type II CAAX endopeptidase family protein [Streptomyces diacarni]